MSDKKEEQKQRAFRWAVEEIHQKVCNEWYGRITVEVKQGQITMIDNHETKIPPNKNT
jgi:hypothetical protein